MAASLPDKSISYWIDSTPETTYPKLEKDLRVDVAIIGGGIAGLTAAILLKKEGAKVALLEATRIVRGVTGYTTAKITSQHRLIYHTIQSRFGEEGALAYAEANQAGLELIAQWVRQKKIDCDFRRKSAYVYTLSKKEISILEKEYKASEKAKLPASLVSSTTLQFSIEGALCFTQQAEFHPRKYLLALAQEIPGAGSFLFEETRVLSIKDGSPCEATTSHGKIRAKSILIATHFPIADRSLYFARMAPMSSYALGVRIQGEPPDGMFIGTRDGWPSIRSHPTPQGEMLIVVGEGHKTGQGGDTLARYRRLAEFSKKNFDVKAINYRWMTEDYSPHDGIPFIGAFSPFSKNLYVATGFQKWGMTNGAAAGMILSDLILEKKNPWAFLFNPQRLKTFCTKRMITENWNAASGMVKDYLKSKKGPICPHLGCVTHWNNAEKTWDCPCHGSRFDEKGHMFHGPATRDIKLS